jgi:hypothetical protein
MSAGGAEDSHRNRSQDGVVRDETAPMGFRLEAILPESTSSSLSAFPAEVSGPNAGHCMLAKLIVATMAK